MRVETERKPPRTRSSRTENAFYRRLIEGMRCGILIIDRQGRVIKVNDLGRQILEIGPEDRSTAPIEEVLREHPQLAQVLHESFSMSSLPNRAEMDLRLRSQRGKTIGFTVSLVRAEDGGPVGAAIFFKDLTHVEHKEEQERLRDRLAALGQMAANLAHEIRNPLASIEVTSSLLKRRAGLDEAARDMLDRITKEVRRLNRTITSSLEFVRPVSLSLAPSRIEPILEEALSIAIGRQGWKGIRVERAYQDRIPPTLMDRNQVRQVFENLFINALEAMQGQGILSVETTMASLPAAANAPDGSPASPAGGEAWSSFGSYLVVRVGDTGPGIPEELRDKLFYPFFTTKKDGSGVGLSMAKKVVDSHRGLIDVQNRPGGGAQFTVRLPIMDRLPGR
jgi:PAS domain S-box-containing protein